MQLSNVSIHAFIQENQIKTENGSPLEFHKHRFLYDIYADRSPFIVAMKAAQIGFTTYEILKSLHEAKTEGIDIIYVLPTADDVKQFSGGKTNRMIDNNPILQEWTRDKDSVEQKRIGGATIYYRGSWTERTALMISATKLIVDEFDRCKQEIIEQYDSRLQHADKPRKAFFSNPSFPDFGVDKFYQLSDKKQWHINHSCGNLVLFDEACVNYTTEHYVCTKCSNAITVEEIRMGDWYDRMGNKWDGEIKTGDLWSGWTIPLWINPSIPASKIAEYKRTKSSEYFYNFVAGLPYVNANDALSQRALEKCLSKEVNPQTGRIIIGMDSGHNLNYVMANKDGVFYHGYCPSVEEMGRKPGYDPYNEIRRRLIEYPRSVLMADQGGDLIGIRKIQADFPGRVFLVWFTKETRNKEMSRWAEKEEYGKVLADRNRWMQMGVDYVNEQRITFNGIKEDWQPFFDHALNIYRVKEISGQDENDPQYGWRWVWRRKGPDHLWLALVYALIGLERFSEDLAVIVSKKSIFSELPISYQEGEYQPLNRKIIRGESMDF